MDDMHDTCLSKVFREPHLSDFVNFEQEFIDSMVSHGFSVF